MFQNVRVRVPCSMSNLSDISVRITSRNAAERHEFPLKNPFIQGVKRNIPKCSMFFLLSSQTYLEIFMIIRSSVSPQLCWRTTNEPTEMEKLPAPFGGSKKEFTYFSCKIGQSNSIPVTLDVSTKFKPSLRLVFQSLMNKVWTAQRGGRADWQADL